MLEMEEETMYFPTCWCYSLSSEAKWARGMFVKLSLTLFASHGDMRRLCVAAGRYFYYVRVERVAWLDSFLLVLADFLSFVQVVSEKK